jgi:5-methyltetrahydropteroyltriglutamate--homocysteine methyltransferase
MRRSTDRMLATHIGSLPRPAGLLDLMSRLHRQREAVDSAELAAAVRASVSEVVRRQVDAQISVVNDGEQSKWAYMSYFGERMQGFELLPAADAETVQRSLEAEWLDFPTYFDDRRAQRDTFTRANDRWVCTGPIAYGDGTVLATDIANLKAAAPAAGADDLFMSAISPGMVRNTANSFYADEDSFLEALAEALRVEYEAIASAGITLQIDSPDLGIGPRGRQQPMEDYRRRIAGNIELLNFATRTIDPDCMRMHVCWGADEAPHHLDVPLAETLDLLLEARPAGLTVVAANGRHEFEWRVWRETKLPDGKVLIPGVIDSTTNIIEHPETVCDRIERFASVVGRENLIAGVDCGMASVASMQQVDAEVAWAKLASLGKGARRATETLYGTDAA